eukprot:766081-Hanusia_phi.AAC.1
MRLSELLSKKCSEQAASCLSLPAGNGSGGLAQSHRASRSSLTAIDLTASSSSSRILSLWGLVVSYHFTSIFLTSLPSSAHRLPHTSLLAAPAQPA